MSDFFFLHRGLFISSQYNMLSTVNKSLQCYFANGFLEGRSYVKQFGFSLLGCRSKGEKKKNLKNKGVVSSVQQGKKIENIWGNKFNKFQVTRPIGLNTDLLQGSAWESLPSALWIEVITEVTVRKQSWYKTLPMSVKSLQARSLEVSLLKRNTWKYS